MICKIGKARNESSLSVLKSHQSLLCSKVRCAHLTSSKRIHRVIVVSDEFALFALVSAKANLDTAVEFPLLATFAGLDLTETILAVPFRKIEHKCGTCLAVSACGKIEGSNGICVKSYSFFEAFKSDVCAGEQFFLDPLPAQLAAYIPCYL